jgi:DNA polymerase-3 subunit delta'
VREQIAAGSHPNLEVLRRRPRDSKSFYTVIRVDDIRHMIDALHMTRGRAGHRLAVIDPIDDCNPSAAQCAAEDAGRTAAGRDDLSRFAQSRAHPADHSIPLPEGCVAAHCRCRRDQGCDGTAPGCRSRRAGTGRGAGRRTAATCLRGSRCRRRWAAGDARSLACETGGGPRLPPNSIWPRRLPQRHARRLWALRASSSKHWMLDEARASAAVPGARRRLASACELWEKASGQFAQTEALNLDMRQTLVSIFDAIRLHAPASSPVDVRKPFRAMTDTSRSTSRPPFPIPTASRISAMPMS